MTGRWAPLHSTSEDSMLSHASDFESALTLIRRLANALGESDASAGENKRRSIQEAKDLLARHKADEPTFSG